MNPESRGSGFDASHRPGTTTIASSRLRRRDHFLHQPCHASDIAGGIDGIPQPHHHEILRRHDHDALAEIPDAKKESRGKPRLTRPLALGWSLRLVKKPAA